MNVRFLMGTTFAVADAVRIYLLLLFPEDPLDDRLPDERLPKGVAEWAISAG
jgi:hypothetical protein